MKIPSSWTMELLSIIQWKGISSKEKNFERILLFLFKSSQKFFKDLQPKNQNAYFDSMQARYSSLQIISFRFSWSWMFLTAIPDLFPTWSDVKVCLIMWSSTIHFQSFLQYAECFIVMCLTPKKTKNERFLQTFRIWTMNSNIWLIFQTFSLPIIGIQLFHQWTSGFRPSNGHWTHY